jgi:diguanylate cyclase (GGDEF)-like protein
MRKLNTKIILLCVLFSLFTSCLIGGAAYVLTKNNLINMTQAGLQNETRVLAFSLSNRYLEMKDDLTFLHATPPIGALIRAYHNNGVDPDSQDDSLTWKRRLATIFKSLLKTKQDYTQIRFIGVHALGKEIVRVNQTGGQIDIVAETELQSKAREVYFLQGIQLPKGKFYYSNITYNREHGKLDGQLVPTLRAIMPVYDDDKIFGLLVINVNFSTFLTNAIKNADLNRSILLYSPQNDIFISDPKKGLSHYVHHEQSNKVKKQKSLSESINLIDNVKKNAKQQDPYHSDNQMAYFMKLSFEPQIENSGLGVIVEEERGQLLAPFQLIYHQLIGLTLIIASSGLLVIAVITGRLMRPLHAMTSEIQHSDSLAELKQLPIEQKDEIGELARAFQAKTRLLKKLATVDPLTGLGNRNSFLEYLPQAIASAKRCDCLLTLVYIDIDDFKKVNDALTHQTGDELLKQVAHRLIQVTRKNDTIYRLGGDEFAVILENLLNTDEVALAAERFIQMLNSDYQIKGSYVSISSSVGIAIYPYAGSEAETLFQNADIAMYRAKELGKNTFAVFDENIDQRVKRQHALNVAMPIALSEHQFELYYQPLLNAVTFELSGLEVLLRWKNIELGDPSPGEFIPIAELNRQIIPIGQYMLRQAIDDFNFMQQQVKIDVPHISINLSVVQLLSDNFFTQTMQQITTAHFDPAKLILEVTETALLEDVQMAKVLLEKFASKGISLALDDFGTGYSSLQYLKHLPLSVVKIDRSFVKEICHDKNDLGIVKAIISLAKVLNLSTIAEGVETEAQVNVLKQEGAQHFQGYYFAKPMPLKDVIHYINTLDPSAYL